MHLCVALVILASISYAMAKPPVNAENKSDIVVGVLSVLEEEDMILPPYSRTRPIGNVTPRP